MRAKESNVSKPKDFFPAEDPQWLLITSAAQNVHLEPQPLVSVAWALATTATRGVTIRRAVHGRLKEFQLKDLARLAWCSVELERPEVGAT